VWKRFISVLLLLYFSWCLFSEVPQSSTQESLTSLEDFVISFENESLTQKILIEDLQKQLNEANQSVETLNAQLTEISQARAAVEVIEEVRVQVQSLEMELGGFDSDDYYSYWDSVFGLQQ